jgi:diguanylate cyclase (GGDEF)-like protein
MPTGVAHSGDGPDSPSVNCMRIPELTPGLGRHVATTPGDSMGPVGRPSGFHANEGDRGGTSSLADVRLGRATTRPWRAQHRAMTAADAARMSGRLAPGGIGGAARDLSIAGTARFRATQRSRIKTSARGGMLMVVAAALLDCLVLPPFHPDAVGLVLGLNLPLAVLALVGRRVMGGRRSRPELVVFAVLVAVVLATAALGSLDRDLEFIAAGYLLLLPVVVSLAVPWTTRTHCLWLTLQIAIVVGYTVTSPGDGAGGIDEHSILTLLVVSAMVSLYGHLANLHARVQSYLQIARIAALNRQAARDHARLERLNRTLEDTARTDEMTGLRNRLCLRADLAAARSRIDRLGERYALLMVDLDRFKTINDTFGHLAGDRALRSVADALAANLRPDDGAYRVGGEEFLLVLRVNDLSEAAGAAERIRRAVEALNLPHPGNTPHHRMTVSIGVAVVDTADLAMRDDQWFARADGALYVAKATGRNRSELAREPERDDGVAVPAEKRAGAIAYEPLTATASSTVSPLERSPEIVPSS